MKSMWQNRFDLTGLCGIAMGIFFLFITIPHKMSFKKHILR